MVVLRFSAAFALFFFFATALGRGLAEKVEEIEGRSLNNNNDNNREEDYNWDRIVVTQRRLIGPGSSPPTCRARCGRCNPCKPVHVAIHPGSATPLEYYPEAWRCKCGNKIFMP